MATFSQSLKALRRHFSWTELIILAALLTPSFAFSQTVRQSSSTEERLIRLEEGQNAIEKRLDDTNKRIGDLNASINGRFDDTNRRIDDLRAEMSNRFDDLRFWLGLITTAVFAALAGLFGLWLYLIRNLRQPASGVNGRAVAEQRHTEFEEMQKRLAALEIQLKQMQSGPA